MLNFMDELNSPLFTGIAPEDRKAMLHCTGYHVTSYEKGEIIAFESDSIRHVGIVISGAVDMVKEDIWGNKTMLIRIRKNEVFGETFACGEDSTAVVSFVVSEDAHILFMPFCKTLHTCANTCASHQRLTENMVKVIASKNRELMRKIEVVSKRTIREKLLTYLSLQAQLHESRYFEIPLGRVELAEYLCVDRSALTRELTKMREEGLIDYDKNCFRMLKN